MNKEKEMLIVKDETKPYITDIRYIPEKDYYLVEIKYANVKAKDLKFNTDKRVYTRNVDSIVNRNTNIAFDSEEKMWLLNAREHINILRGIISEVAVCDISNWKKILKLALERDITLNRENVILLNDEILHVTHFRNEYAFAICVNNSESFQAQDLRRETNKIIEIESIVSLRKGYGAELLKEICDTFRDYAIILKAEPVFENLEDYEECSDEEYFNYLNNLIRYYESHGFVNINDCIGYEGAAAMMYSKDYSGEMLKSIWRYQ